VGGPKIPDASGLVVGSCTLEFCPVLGGLQIPDGLVVIGSYRCTGHPGVLVSIPKREKTGAPCVEVPGSSRVPLYHFIIGTALLNTHRNWIMMKDGTWKIVGLGVWVCLLMQYLLQSCSRGGRGMLEDMCYEGRRAEACVN
jgi:hypothetical protein